MPSQRDFPERVASGKPGPYGRLPGGEVLDGRLGVAMVGTTTGERATVLPELGICVMVLPGALDIGATGETETGKIITGKGTLVTELPPPGGVDAPRVVTTAEP